MKTEQNNLDRLKGKNPFTVPEGYMEGLTANIMSQLPEREPEEEVKKVSLMDRVLPGYIWQPVLPDWVFLKFWSDPKIKRRKPTRYS